MRVIDGYLIGARVARTAIVFHARGQANCNGRTTSLGAPHCNFPDMKFDKLAYYREPQPASSMRAIARAVGAEEWRKNME